MKGDKFMAEIGIGYGSEYQLLRFLGHHREEVEAKIKAETRYNNKLRWLDFPYKASSLSGDGEEEGISFLEKHPAFKQIKTAWSEFWPRSGKKQNWDAILLHDDEYVLVEAKAHLEEIESTCGASPKSKEMINEAMKATRDSFGINSQNDWLEKYYQLANRLAFVKFMLDNGIKASLLYVYFINGYDKRKIGNGQVENKSVKTRKDWEVSIDTQDNYLGIQGTIAENFISKIFVDCKKS